MPRIAILLPDLRGGGAERVSLDLGKAFAELGHQVTSVLMQARGELLNEALPAFQLLKLCCDRTQEIPHALTQHLRRHPFALIAHTWPPALFAALAIRLSSVCPRR